MLLRFFIADPGIVIAGQLLLRQSGFRCSPARQIRSLGG